MTAKYAKYAKKETVSAQFFSHSGVSSSLLAFISVPILLSFFAYFAYFAVTFLSFPNRIGRQRARADLHRNRFPIAFHFALRGFLRR